MTTLRTAAQQALEALLNCNSDYGHRCNRCDSEVDEGGKVVTALRTALEQEQAEPVQEPVAYIHRQGNHWEVSERHLDEDERDRGWTEEPLYTAPPKRKPLTEEEIMRAFYGHRLSVVEIARAVERAHGIGDNT